MELAWQSEELTLALQLEGLPSGYQSVRWSGYLSQSEELTLVWRLEESPSEY